MTIQQILRKAQRRLSAAPGLHIDDRDNALREAQLLLAHTLSCQRSYLLAYPELELSDAKQRDFCALLERRCRGEPVAYLTGHKEFYGLDLRINAAVLVPRPETELLVEQALLRLPKTGTAADLGTGSGAIAIALAKHRPRAHILATDLSGDALQLARANAEHHHLDNIQFHGGHWLEALPRSAIGLDVIVSNPPYIDAGDRHLIQGDCRFEPRLALTPGEDGLDALREITARAPGYLRTGGWLLLEHGYDQGDAVQALFTQGRWADVETLTDLAGQPRVSLARLADSQN